jgi:hypothetical protein
MYDISGNPLKEKVAKFDEISSKYGGKESISLNG